MTLKTSTHHFQNFSWIDLCHPTPQQMELWAHEHGLNFYQIKDSLEAGHLPKFEIHEDSTFVILRAFTSNINLGETNITQLTNKIAFYYDAQKCITLHRTPFPFLEQHHSHYDSPEAFVLHMIHKMLVTYEAPLASLEDKLALIEKSVFLDRSTSISLVELYTLKTQARILKKLLGLIQDVVVHLQIPEACLASHQDIKDKLVRLLLDCGETFENAKNLFDAHHSITAQRDSEVTRVLTVFSAFFLPLTFVVGVYGMNFNHMPELNWQYGYAGVLVLMLLISSGIYLWFRKKGFI